MASIRNSISLTDKMSPVLRTMLRSMDANLKVMQKLDQQASRGTQSRSFQNAANSISRANKELDRMDRKMGSVNKSASGVASSFSRVGSSGFNLTNLASALYLIKNIGDALSNIMEAPDLAKSTQARLGLFNESPYTSQQLYDQVYKTALNTRSDLGETGNLATRIMVSGAMQGENGALGALKVTDLINKALVAGGGTAEENKRAMLQLSQGLSSGVLQGDELRSLREQVPYLTSLLAKGLGNVDPKFKDLTIGDLKQLGADGQLTTERIIKAFLSMDKEINKSFEKMPKTFGQAMTSMETVWDYFLYKLSLGEGPLAKVTEAAWDFVGFLTSADGEKFLTGLGDSISVVVQLLLMLFDVAGNVYSFLEENSNVVIAALGALAAAFTIMGTAALIAWIEAAWPILLVAALVGVLIYVFLELGYTVGEIAGAVAGAFAFIGASIWDLLLISAAVLMGVGAVVWDALVWLGQGIISILALVGNAFILIGKVLAVVFGSIIAVVEVVIMGVVALFQGLSDAVLGIIWGIASAIDFVFGTHLADGVKGWLDSVNKMASEAYKALDPTNMAIADQDFFAKGWIDMEQASTLLDPYVVDPMFGKGMVDDLKWWIDPAKTYQDVYDPTKKNVDDFFNNLDKLDLGTSSVEDLLSKLGMDEILDGVNVKGGYLDGIKDSVDISDEDLKLLRDVAAKEFLVNVATITPTMNVRFGDVRETADPYKMMEIMEDMAEEALGTVLVEDY